LWKIEKNIEIIEKEHQQNLHKTSTALTDNYLLISGSTHFNIHMHKIVEALNRCEL